jgi:hypothetical protein
MNFGLYIALSNTFIRSDVNSHRSLAGFLDVIYGSETISMQFLLEI